MAVASYDPVLGTIAPRGTSGLVAGQGFSANACPGTDRAGMLMGTKARRPSFSRAGRTPERAIPRGCLPPGRWRKPAPHLPHGGASQVQWRMENDPGPVDVMRRRLPCIVRQRAGVAMTPPSDAP